MTPGRQGSESRPSILAAQALCVVNAIFWVLMGVASLGRMASSAGLTWPLALLMLGNAGAMLCLAWGLVRKPRPFYYLALAVLGLNMLLTVTDQFGLVDLIALLIAAALLALLVATRASYVPAGRGRGHERKLTQER